MRRVYLTVRAQNGEILTRLEQTVDDRRHSCNRPAQLLVDWPGEALEAPRGWWRRQPPWLRLARVTVPVRISIELEVEGDDGTSRT